MRRCAVALSGAVLVATGLSLPYAEGSTPANSNLTVPTTPGQSVSVTYTGTIPAASVNPNECATEGGTTADAHTVTITAPPGGYKTVNAVFLVSIKWTPNVNEATSDEILTLEAPNGRVIGSSDGGTPSEAMTVRNLPSGTYTMLACGFNNAASQADQG